MIVSYEHLFIFIKTRKTAGSSVELYLRNFLGKLDRVTGSAYDGVDYINCPPQTRGHMGHWEIKKYVGDNTWNACWKFAFERNPWDKAVSDYLFKTRVKLIDPETTFDKYLNGISGLSDWNRYTEGDEPVATLYKYEYLEDSMKVICDRLKIPFDLDKFNENRLKASPDRKPYAEYYNDEQVETVRKAFEKEIDYFGYEFKRT